MCDELKFKMYFKSIIIGENKEFLNLQKERKYLLLIETDGEGIFLKTASEE